VTPQPPVHDPSDVDVHFLDVGQGDSTLIIDHGSAKALLIDCNSKGFTQVRRLLEEAAATLAVAVVTHFHVDHYGSVPRLLDLHPSAVAAYNPILTVTDPEQGRQVRAVLRAFAGRTQPPPTLLIEGVTGSLGRVKWHCHAPDTTLLTAAAGGAGPNRASAVLEVVFGDLRLLLTADADAPVWRHVLDRVDHADVLRVSHHGGPLNDPGMTPELIVEALRPARSIVSVGTINDHGHPDASWTSAAGSVGRVMCTEVTRLCHPDLKHRKPASACAGDVALRWWATGVIEVTPDDAWHDAVVDGWAKPACRYGLPGQPGVLAELKEDVSTRRPRG